MTQESMVEILEKINEVKLIDVSGGFDCSLINYGCMRDTIGHYNYIFKSGIYILEGECATGGWALSTILTGKDKTFEGQIWFNQKKVDWRQIKQNSCYVGEDSGIKKCFKLIPMSVCEQIEYGIYNKLSYNNYIEQIKENFGLFDERFNRTIKYYGIERWRASMAIGYAMGKTIYRFPWMNSKLIMQLKDCLKLCIKSLLEIDAIIIIPTTKKQSCHNIFEEFAVLKFG